MATFIINVDTDKILKEKHISWNVTEDNENYHLSEIIERYYEHPDSEGCAMIPRIEVDCIKVIKKTDIKHCSHLIQLQAALNTVSQIMDK